MSAIAGAGASTEGTDPPRLTFIYSENPGGAITVQIEEFPAAISQGATRHEAWVNVLDALHDLTHEPTSEERLAYAIKARVIEPLGHVLGGLRLWRRGL